MTDTAPPSSTEDLTAQFALLPRHRQATLLAMSTLLDAAQPHRPRLQPCGTRAAYRRHLKDGEAPCDACTDAARRRERERRRPAAGTPS